MKIFLTGATGFIGRHVTRELTDAGHEVLGLVRDPAKAGALTEAGGKPHRGNLLDAPSLTAGASACDAVIHCGFNHDFTRFAQSCEEDRQIIATLAAALEGTERPMLVTSGISMQQGRPAVESDPPPPASVMPRAATEEAVAAARAAAVNVGVVRLPQVHDTRRQGFVSLLVQKAVETGVSAYVGKGENRWTACHVRDVARLYRLAIERATPGAVYHAIDEGALPVRTLAEAIGARLSLPVRSIPADEAEAHFGWIAGFAQLDVPGSSDWTRAELGWQPRERGMLADLAELELAAA